MPPPENGHLQLKWVLVFGFLLLVWILFVCLLTYLFSPPFPPFYWLPTSFPAEWGERSQGRCPFLNAYPSI